MTHALRARLVDLVCAFFAYDGNARDDACVYERMVWMGERLPLLAVKLY